MFTEEELLPLSALQHLLFCERQCALIHIEQLWTENLFTAEGRIMHERVHEADRASRGELRVEYGMPIRSLKLGLIGKADVVEFHRKKEGSVSKWQPFPVEYKRGKPKRDNCDRVQLCAQALCLEEMRGATISEGALFYGKTRRRENVTLDHELRAETEKTAKRLHDLISLKRTPKPIWCPKCRSCSLLNLCMPKTLVKARSVNDYLLRITKEP